MDRYTHRFHTYPARLHPDAARALFAVLEGDVVLDPFCGGGTVLVEAMAAQRQAVGRDINPVAKLVATARTRLVEPEHCQAIEAAGARLAREARTLAASGDVELPAAVHELRAWYGPHALAELGALHALCESMPSSERLLLRAVHSSLVVKYSRRQSDTSAERVVVRDAPGWVTRAFRDRTAELARMLGELRTAAGEGPGAARVELADARSRQPCDADLVVTSPPYPATYDYVEQQHLRLAWLSASADVPEARAWRTARTVEIGTRRSFRASVDAGYERWAKDTERWLGRVRDQLRPGGMLAVLIGDGLAGGRQLPTREATVQAARAEGLELVAGLSVERVDPGMRLAKREHALVFVAERPDKTHPPRTGGRQRGGRGRRDQA